MNPLWEMVILQVQVLLIIMKVKFYGFILEHKNQKNVLEIGHASGCSTVVLASAIET